MDAQKLTEILQRYGIPFDTWGMGEAKTFDDLLKDMRTGEAKLETHEGKLVWATRAVGVRVWHYDHVTECVYKLVEDKQVFADGRIRHRKNISKASVMEKMRPSEDIYAAAERAIREELGIRDARIVFGDPPGKAERVGPKDSISYPGLLSRFTINIFDWFVSKELYKPEGYVEEQKDKKTYFMWQKETIEAAQT